MTFFISPEACCDSEVHWDLSAESWLHVLPKNLFKIGVCRSEGFSSNSFQFCDEMYNTLAAHFSASPFPLCCNYS